MSGHQQKRALFNLIAPQLFLSDLLHETELECSRVRAIASKQIVCEKCAVEGWRKKSQKNMNIVYSSFAETANLNTEAESAPSPHICNKEPLDLNLS